VKGNVRIKHQFKLKTQLFFNDLKGWLECFLIRDGSGEQDFHFLV
jgi:hypothetical protein